MKSLKGFLYALLLCACFLSFLSVQSAQVGISGESEDQQVSSSLVPVQQSFLHQDKKLLPLVTSSTSLENPDKLLRALQEDDWVKVGNDIDGESSNDESGYSVAISDNGSRVAIGARFNAGETAGPKSGHVRVYDYDASNDGWVQVGNDIDGEYYNDKDGYSVDMNGIGSRVIIGAQTGNNNGGDSGRARVFEYDEDNDAWVQVGNTIVGVETNDYAGCSVAMSNYGSRVAVGARYNEGEYGATSLTNSGHVRVFDYDTNINDWVQVGNDIDGSDSHDQFGFSVDMSNDGSRVAVGAPFNDDNGNDSGHVRVYEFNTINDAWVQLGGDMLGETAGDYYGWSVSLGVNGSRVAIGTPYPDNKRGHVRVFDYINDAWVQLGGDIDGEVAYGESGISVSLSNDGRLAIGAQHNTGNGQFSGHTRVFDYIDDVWVQVGSDIDGDNGDKAGFSVALSSDGARVVIGAPDNNDNGVDSGQVRVYAAGSTPTPSPTGSPTPSPTGSPTPSPTGSPTPSPTGSPTPSPTGSPTPSPTSSPTPSPTSSPTIVPANQGSFEIHSTGDITGSATSGTTIDLIARYNASNRVHKTTVLSPDCIHNFTGTAVDAFIVTDSADVSLGGGFISYESKITVDISKVNNTQWWKNLPDAGTLGGIFDMCLESAVYFELSDGTTEKMNFVDTNVTVKVEMDANFNITAIDTERKDATKQDLALDYSDYVTAYQCVEGSESSAILGKYSQGDVLKICVKSTDSSIVQVGSIKSLVLSQTGTGGGGDFSYITNGEVANEEIANTECDTTSSVHVCHADMLLLGRYFDVDEEPADLTASGSVELAFPTGRRLTVDVPIAGIRGSADLDRRMEEETRTPPEDASFNVKVSLDPSPAGGSGSIFCGATTVLIAAIGSAILMV